MKYHITPEPDYVPEPEESLWEQLGDTSKIGRLIPNNFMGLFYFSAIAFLVIIFVIIFKFQIVDAEKYSAIVENNKYFNISILPQRGMIFDRNNQLLAGNGKEYNIILTNPKKVSDETLNVLSQIIGTKEELEQALEKGQNQGFVVVAQNVDLLSAEEIRKQNIPGVYIQENNIRRYEDGEIFSHILGYVSLASEVKLDQDESYESGDLIGVNGIEAEYEDYLRGERGKFLIPRFKALEESGLIKVEEPKSGHNVFLNIDSNLQGILYESLKQGLAINKSSKAAGIIQNPKTGEVLALVSLPSFDNNVFYPLDETKVLKLIENRDKPLFNRVLSGRYAPGSTIKPLFALAALEEDIIDPSKKILSAGSISVPSIYDPSVVYTYKDWKAHGWVNMWEAIASSVDIYFYTIGGGYGDIDGLGIDRMASYLKEFLADKKTGVDLPSEVAGLVPDKEWKQQTKGEDWFIGDSYNLSIGQGDLLITPIWLNGYIGAIANEGFFYKPEILNRVVNEDGEMIKSFEPQVLTNIVAEQEHFEVVKQGMLMAGTEGTLSRFFKDLSVKVGAKSGTAEVIKGKTVNSWVSIFAPYDDPELTMTILVEEAQDNLAIAPYIAQKVLQEYFKDKTSNIDQ